MIEGVVNAELEALIRVSVTGSPNAVREVEAVIDSGYNGYLTLPLATVVSLSLSHFGRERVELADGSLQIFEMYLASVRWDGQARTVVIDAAETAPLAGTALLAGYDFSARFVPGGRVTIIRVPQGEISLDA